MTEFTVRASRTEIACLMYHDITNVPSSSGFRRASARAYELTPEAFGHQVAQIQQHACAPETVEQLELWNAGRHLMLTFDDGGTSALDAAECLGKHGWAGHFFVVTGRIGEAGFLDREGIRALRAAGHVVGSHSHTHPDIMRDLPRSRLIDEWRVSARILEDILGEPCVAASVPGGDLSTAVIDTAAESGFRYLFTSEPLLEPRRVRGMWLIGRYCVKRATPASTVVELAQFKGWRLALLERLLKELPRRGLAPLYRMYMDRVARAQPVVV